MCSSLFKNWSCRAEARELPREFPRDMALDGGGISLPVSAEYWHVRGLVPVPGFASCTRTWGWFAAGGAALRAMVRDFSSSLQPSVTGTAKTNKIPLTWIDYLLLVFIKTPKTSSQGAALTFWCKKWVIRKQMCSLQWNVFCTYYVWQWQGPFTGFLRDFTHFFMDFLKKL